MTFTLTPQQFRQKAEEIGRATGTVLNDKAGEITHQGVTVAYSYDGATVSVQIKHKPMLVPQGLLESKITAWFTA